MSVTKDMRQSQSVHGKKRRDARVHHPIAAPRTQHEEYSQLPENKFTDPRVEGLSTFSIDVDRASYSNARRFLRGHKLPPPAAIRTEEFINYLKYDLPQPKAGDDHPFIVDTDYTPHPWLEGAGLLRVSLHGTPVVDKSIGSNLVFLLDVSGSMAQVNKLPLLKRSFHLLLDQLSPTDRVSIVVYAGAAGVVLEPTEVSDRAAIRAALRSLESGGSTAGGAGIQLAYDLAAKHFIPDGNNRVILATDGDFNVGVSQTGDLEDLITARRDEGVFLTVLGFGMGNYKDNRLETLADKGNGNYAYIDNIMEAQKIFGHELDATLFTIAKDVKIQLEFNPAYVKQYRLIGYENRRLAKEDFNDDTKDAGELGAGHQVTALYEIIPVGADIAWPGHVDPLKYQQEKPSADTYPDNGELCTVKLRYKRPDADKSRYLDQVVSSRMDRKADPTTYLAAGVAAWALKMAKSDYLRSVSYDDIHTMISDHQSTDEHGYIAEMLTLVSSAALLDQTEDASGYGMGR